MNKMMNKSHIKLYSKGLALRLREVRKEARYTREEFAKILGVSKRTVIRFESGSEGGGFNANHLINLHKAGINDYYVLCGEKVRGVRPTKLYQELGIL